MTPEDLFIDGKPRIYGYNGCCTGLIDSVKEAKNNSSAKSNQNENENNNFEIQKINKQISMIQSKIDNLSKYTKFNNNKSNEKWKI